MESKFVALLNPPQEFLAALNKVDNYKSFCQSKLAECDRALSDIDHLLELTKLDGVKMVRVTSKRKEILLERRFYKDEIERCLVVSQAMPSSQNVHGQLNMIRAKLKECEEHITARAFTPRVLFDIFDYDDETKEQMRQTRQDLTKLGKRASKKALRMEEKFRQIEGEKHVKN